MRTSIRQFSEHWSRHELDLCRKANRWVCQRALWRYFALVSRLGDGVFWYLLMLGLCCFGGIKGAQAAAHLAVLGLVTLALYKSLKQLSRRGRPASRDGALILRVAPLDEFSFPSGHTLHAVAFTWVSLAYFPALAWLLLPFAASVAVSRVVLGLHYPSDVLAALGLGACLAELSLLWIAP